MKEILLLGMLLIFTACETGVKYEDEKSNVKVSSHHAIKNLIERDESATAMVERSYIEPYEQRIKESYEEAPLARKIPKKELFIEESENENLRNESLQYFKGGIVSDGLNVKAVRVGKHKTYTRLVFDIDKWIDSDVHGGKVKEVGSYGVEYNTNNNTIVVVMDGYRGFSAKLPTFSRNSIIEKIFFNNYLDDSGFKFTIKLRENSTLKVYDYKNPARLIMDIKSFI